MDHCTAWVSVRDSRGDEQPQRQRSQQHEAKRDPGPVDECRGERQAAAHAAGRLPDPFAAVAVDLDQLEQLTQSRAAAPVADLLALAAGQMRWTARR